MDEPQDNMSQSTDRPSRRYAAKPLNLDSDRTQEPVSKPKVVKQEPSPGSTATEQQLEDKILDTARAPPSQPALQVTDNVTNVTNVTHVINDMPAQQSSRALEVRSIDAAVLQLPSQGPSPRVPQLLPMIHDLAVRREGQHSSSPELRW
jgi:hypothetical protein